MADYAETLMAIAIIAAVFIVHWLAKRDGRNNPVNTGPLNTKMIELGAKFDIIDGEVKKIRADLDAQPSAADIEELRGDVKVVCERVEGLEGFIKRTDDAVVRIENILLNGAAAAVATVSGRGRRK